MWTPENNSEPLATTLSSLTLMDGCLKLWGEYLRGYFDGAYHDGILYPSATFMFQEDRITQPLNGLSIHVMAASGTSSNIIMEGQQWIRNKADFSIHFRSNVSTPRVDGHTTKSLAAYGADCLFALLNGRNPLPLTRAGITQIRPSPPRLLASDQYSMRTILAKTVLQCVKT